MAVKLITVKCPKCDADLSLEGGRDSYFCLYCGTKLIMNNENEVIYRSIDEARIKETETDRMIRLAELEIREKELELKEREIEIERKNKAIGYKVAAGLAVIGVIMLIADSYLGAWMIIAAIVIASINHNDRRKKRDRNTADRLR